MLKEDIESTRTVSKKNIGLPFIFHMPPNDLCACFGGRAILVSMQSYFQWIFGNGWSSWFKLVSSKQNHQPPKKVIFTELKFVVYNFSYYFDMTMAASLKDTRRQKFNFTNLKTITCLGFFNIEEFYWSCYFGFFWWILFTVKPICCAYRNCRRIFTNIFCLPLTFHHHEKVV